MNKCKICNKLSVNNLSDLIFNGCICSKCQNKFILFNKLSVFEGHEILTLYKYEGEGKTILYNFKANKDIQLASVFTFFFKSFLKEKYKGYSFYCAPSNNEDNLERGFNHVEEIAKCVSKKVYSPFSKNTIWKQAGKSAKERANIEKVIEYKEIDTNDKVVLIDDVISTGSTLKACLKFLSHKRDVKILTIFKNEL